MVSWAANIDAITLFVEDLAAAKAFYPTVFDLPVFFEDENSAVFKFGDDADQPARDLGGARADRAGVPSRRPAPARGTNSRSAWTTSTRCARC